MLTRPLAILIAVFLTVPILSNTLWAFITQDPGLGDIGQPLPTLQGDLRNAFFEGKRLFDRSFSENEGRGIQFNHNRCANCHGNGGVGGAGATIETRIGAISGPRANPTAFSPLLELGGPIKQDNATEGPQEIVPTQEQVSSRLGPEFRPITSLRSTTLVAGNGILTMIPDSQIQAEASRQDSTRPFGSISGRANVLPPEDRVGDLIVGGQIGRLGWKAQLPHNTSFLADAAVEEMGLSNFLNPSESQSAVRQEDGETLNRPERRIDPNRADLNREQLLQITTFCAGMPGPAPKEEGERVTRGAQVFNRIGCAECHSNRYQVARTFNELPALQSPPLPPEFSARFRQLFAAIREAQGERPIQAFTDLLVHDMGDELADGFTQGQANGREWRTAPLWGLRFKGKLLHDNRAGSIEEAIRMHAGNGSEANPVIAAFRQLGSEDRRALLDFLENL